MYINGYFVDLVQFAMLGSLLFLSGATMTGAMTSSPTTFTLTNKMALLNCTLPPGGNMSSATVTWLRPHDSMPVSRGFVVYQNPGRLMVIGDPTKGQYNLLIRRALFPEDNGTWACLGPSGPIQTVSLVVLVTPPIGEPTVSPTNISITDRSTEAWTLTCASHFAFPPVELSWVKVSGPPAEYDVTLPNMMISSDQTLSSSVKIILTRSNIGSTFKCEAQHPAFRGVAYSKEVHFPGSSMSAKALEQVSREHQIQMRAAMMGEIRKEISPIDTIIITTMACTGAVIFIVIVILVKSSKFWKLDVHAYGSQYFQVSTSDLGGTGDIDEEKAQAMAHENRLRRAHRNCKVQATFGACLSVLLILSLAMSIPIYFKGMTPPDLGTDVFTSVVAGSALWLDCSENCQPPSSVLSVTWRYNHQIVYHQYYSNGQHYGVPHNTTVGFKFTYRASSLRYGQVNVWPVLPGEDGIYSCEVAKLADDQGKTVIARKTFGVFVIAGMIINYALIGLLGIASGCAIILVTLLLYKCVKCQCESRTISSKGSVS